MFWDIVHETLDIGSVVTARLPEPEPSGPSWNRTGPNRTFDQWLERLQQRPLARAAPYIPYLVKGKKSHPVLLLLYLQCSIIYINELRKPSETEMTLQDVGKHCNYVWLKCVRSDRVLCPSNTPVLIYWKYELKICDIK